MSQVPNHPSDPSSPIHMATTPLFQPQPLQPHTSIGSLSASQLQQTRSTSKGRPQSATPGHGGGETTKTNNDQHDDEDGPDDIPSGRLTHDSFDPNDVNYVVIPKHPSFLSPVYRPNLILIQSDEAFIYLRVATLTLLLAFLCPIFVFASNFQVILVCLIGCFLSLFGFLGSLRQVRGLIYLFWYGMIIWVLIALVLVSVMTLFSSHYYDTAVERCSSNPEYVLLFNIRPDGVKIDCAINTHECLARCVSHVERHFFATSSLFAALLTIVMIFCLYQLYNFIQRLIFPLDYARLAKLLYKNQQDKYSSQFPTHGTQGDGDDDDEDDIDDDDFDEDFSMDYDHEENNTNQDVVQRQNRTYFPDNRNHATLNDLNFPLTPQAGRARPRRGGYRYSSDHYNTGTFPYP